MMCHLHFSMYKLFYYEDVHIIKPNVLHLKKDFLFFVFICNHILVKLNFWLKTPCFVCLLLWGPRWIGSTTCLCCTWAPLQLAVTLCVSLPLSTITSDESCYNSRLYNSFMGNSQQGLVNCLLWPVRVQHTSAHKPLRTDSSSAVGVHLHNNIQHRLSSSTRGSGVIFHFRSMEAISLFLQLWIAFSLFYF